MAPLQVMPMSNVRVMSQIVPMAPSTPAPAASLVTTTTSPQRHSDHYSGQGRAALDPRERCAPHDRERDRAEHELEEELGADGGVGERDRGEEVAVRRVHEGPVGPGKPPGPAEGQGEADGPV